MDEQLKGRCEPVWDVPQEEGKGGQRQTIADLRAMAARGQPYLQGGDAGGGGGGGQLCEGQA